MNGAFGIILVGASSGGMTRAALWAGALAGVIVVAGAAVMALRRRLFGSGAPADAPVMELHELRALRERGEVSDEEYESLRAALIRGYGGAEGVRAVVGDGGERRARPGFDLTGAPLPGGAGAGEEEGDGGSAEGDVSSGGPPGSGT